MATRGISAPRRPWSRGFLQYFGSHLQAEPGLARWVAIGRSLMAGAQALTILVTPVWAFHPSVGGRPAGFACEGVARFSPWCLGSTALGEGATKAAVVVVLGLVASGFSPRLTCVPHWWISFGNAASWTLPEGGDQVAQNLTLLLIPVCLCDPRWFAWRSRDTSAESGSFLHGLSAAFLVACRIQVVAIYLDSSLAKLGVAEWLNGTEMYYVFHDLRFGVPQGDVRNLATDATNSGLVVAALTWGSVICELAIALFLCRRRAQSRAFAVCLAAALHLGIFVLIGLFSFAFIMIGAVAIASGAQTLRPRYDAPGPRDSNMWLGLDRPDADHSVNHPKRQKGDRDGSLDRAMQ